MVTTETAIDALTAALALARAEGREVRGMKSLLCDACCEGVAVRAGGFCHRCADEMSQVFDARAAEHAPAIMAEQGEPDGFAFACCAAYDDGEGAAMLAGLNPGKY